MDSARRLDRGKKGAVRRRAVKDGTALLAVALVLAVPQWGYAQSASPSPSPSASLTADDFEQVCGPVLSQKPPTHATELTLYNQKLSICQGAAASHEAMKDQGLLWKLWAGVGAVCGVACAASFFGVGNQYICMGTNLAAGVTEGVVTEDFSAAMSGVMGAGTSFLVNTAMSGAGSAASTTSTSGNAAGSSTSSSSSSSSSSSGSTKDIGACLSAAMAIGQAVSKHASEESARETLDAAMADLAGLMSNSRAAPLPGTVSLSSGNEDTTTTNESSTQTTATSDAPKSKFAESGASCSSTMSTTGEAISCAVGLDSNLPGFVSSPKFQQDFQKASNQSLGDFLGSGSGSIGEAIAGTMGGIMTSSARAQVAAAVENLSESLGHSDPNVGATAYGRGGGRRGPSGGGGDDDIMGQMAGLMGQLLPGGKKAGAAGDTAVQAVQAVMNSARGAGGARIEEDRSLSLFDRVKARYLTLSRAERVGGDEVLRVPAGVGAGTGGEQR